MDERAARNHFNAWLPIGLILTLGAILRFMQMGLIRYTYDQSYPAFQALGLLDGGNWPLIGQPSSVFLDNPVLMVYLQAIPLAIFRSATAVQAFILILNTTAIWFVYRAAADVLTERAGWVAAFLFVVNPWVIYFSRMTWVQSLVPFFMAIIAWGLWPSLVNDRASPGRFLAGGVALTLLTQTYIQAWGILPQVVILLLIFRHRIPRRPFLIALGVFLMASLFYAVGLATRVEANTDKASNFLAAGWQGLSGIGLRHGLRLVNGIDFRPANVPDDPASATWIFLSMAAVVVLTLTLIAGIVRALGGLIRGERERRLAVVLLVWFVAPILLTSVQGAFDVHPHYLLLTLPAGHVLAAWGVESLLHRRDGAAVAFALLLAVGLIFTGDLVRANNVVANQPTMPGFEGWALNAGTEVGGTIRAWATSQSGPYPRRIIASGDKEMLSGLSATLVQPVRGAAYPNFALLSPGAPLLYVFEGGGELPHWLAPFLQPLGNSAQSFGEDTRTTFAVTVPEAVTDLSAPVEEVVEWPSDSGLTLAGYSLNPSPDGALEVLTYWRVDDLHPDRGDWYVAPNYHLVDEVGNIVSNTGEHGQWAHRWESGDVYVERITIPRPSAPGPFKLSIGLVDSVRCATYTFFNDGTPAERYETLLEPTIFISR